MSNNIPPQNIDAERSVLGSILKEQETILEVRNILNPSDFYRPSHGVIYETMIEMYDCGIPIDMVTISEELIKKDSLDKAEGTMYVGSLTEAIYTTANIVHYANIVKDRSIRRQVIRANRKVDQMAYDESVDPEELLEVAQKSIFNLSLYGKPKDGFVNTYEVASRVVDAMSREEVKQMGIPTGYDKLDIWTAGFQPGQLIVVAARPSMGKTSWVVQLAANAVIKHKKKVAFFSLETTADKLIEKMIINQGNINAQTARLRMIHDDLELTKRLADIGGVIAQSDLFINDTKKINIHELVSQCRKLKLEKGLDMVIIDYIGLMQASKELIKKSDVRHLIIAEITRELKIMAMELNIPVVALSQVSRAVENTKDKIPTLTHLRESGSIEQDADTVMFLYRPEYYFPQEKGYKGVTEIILAKQREGPIGTVKVVFQKEFTKFIDIEGHIVNGKVISR